MLSGTGPQLSSLRTKIRPGNVRFLPVSEELREVLLALWKKQKFPVGGYILAAPSGKPVPVILDFGEAFDSPAPRRREQRSGQPGRKVRTDLARWYSLADSTEPQF